ncbi:hypothetical protein HPP92_008081 [Vanilla planifolia]|uniref:Uncharacterized protein n=1 Tax=Vanilla planifolia TaxID=51239 RepID=A0A835RIQ9_VANPL|nr:hypothetical protein HPP92_008081 [Vanilla planifolia]
MLQLGSKYETFGTSSKSSMAAPETDVSKTTGNSLVSSEASHMESASECVKRRLNDD